MGTRLAVVLRKGDQLVGGMKVRVLYVVAVSSAIFCSWLITYVFECYYYGSMSRPSRHPRDAQPPFPDGNPDNIFWFLQISDIHLSYVNKFSVAKDLTYFCSETVDVVNPAVVLVTGKFRFYTFVREPNPPPHTFIREPNPPPYLRQGAKPPLLLYFLQVT